MLCHHVAAVHKPEAAPIAGLQMGRIVATAEANHTKECGCCLATCWLKNGSTLSCEEVKAAANTHHGDSAKTLLGLLLRQNNLTVPCFPVRKSASTERPSDLAIGLSCKRGRLSTCHLLQPRQARSADGIRQRLWIRLGNRIRGRSGHQWRSRPLRTGRGWT